MQSKKLFNRNFTFLLLGQIISVLGTSVLKFAIDLYVLDLTGRADVFATVLAVSYIPFVLFSPIGGVIADRFNRRNLMVIFDICNAAIVASLLFMLVTHRDHISVIFIAIILILLSLITAMYQPTVQASVPEFASEDHLGQSNGFISGVNALSNILGPVLGGVLYGIFGLDTLVLVSCAVFVCAAVMQSFIRISFIKKPQNGTVFQIIASDLKSGFHYMKKKRTILHISLLAVGLNLFLSAFLIVTTPFVLRITMHSSNAMYTVGMALAEVGTIAGALSMGYFSKKITLQNLYKWILFIALALIPMALAVSKGFLSLGYFPSFILYMIFGVSIMMAATIVSIWAITYIQSETPNDLLGKIMSIVLALAQCAMPLGQVIYGGLIERFSSTMFIPCLIAALLTLGIVATAKRILK